MLSRYQVVIQSLAAVTSTGVSRDIVRGGAELRGKSRDSDRKRNRQSKTLSSRFENLARLGRSYRSCPFLNRVVQKKKEKEV